MARLFAAAVLIPSAFTGIRPAGYPNSEERSAVLLAVSLRLLSAATKHRVTTSTRAGIGIAGNAVAKPSAAERSACLLVSRLRATKHRVAASSAAWRGLTSPFAAILAGLAARPRSSATAALARLALATVLVTAATLTTGHRYSLSTNARENASQGPWPGFWPATSRGSAGREWRQTKELAANLATSERRHAGGITFWNVENRVLAGKATYGGYRGEKSQEGD